MYGTATSHRLLGCSYVGGYTEVRMKSVGIRELKARASKVVEAVHTDGRRYQVTG